MKPPMIQSLRRRPMTVLTLLFTFIACFVLWTSAPGQASTLQGEPALPGNVEMQPGDRALLPDGQHIELVGIVEDSRCPADAFCIWQGRAVLEFELAGEHMLVTFIGGESVSEPVRGYAVKVSDVQPYPLALRPTDGADYRVTVTVTAVE
ncbi:MAG: hypothetical protein WD942_09125 [Dehalococcoidia bacterium]